MATPLSNLLYKKYIEAFIIKIKELSLEITEAYYVSIYLYIYILILTIIYRLKIPS
jgi:hypothetical protein